MVDIARSRQRARHFRTEGRSIRESKSMSSPIHQAIAKAMGGFVKVEQIPASIATRKLDYASRRSLASGPSQESLPSVRRRVGVL